MMNARIGLAAATLALVVGGCGSKTNGQHAHKTAANVVQTPGKRVFQKWCADCHAEGPRYPGTASLAVKYGKDMPAALEKRTDLTPETVALFVRQGVSIMPPSRKTEITDAELAALGAYLSHQPEPKPEPSK
jgi:mono/diheme cytochrome c family protein